VTPSGCRTGRIATYSAFYTFGKRIGREEREGEKKKAQEREQDMEVTKNRDEGGIGERKKEEKKRRKLTHPQLSVFIFTYPLMHCLNIGKYPTGILRVMKLVA